MIYTMVFVVVMLALAAVLIGPRYRKKDSIVKEVQDNAQSRRVKGPMK